MGGMVTVVFRSSLKETTSFKVYTEFMDKNINDFSFLDEETMNQFLNNHPQYKEPCSAKEHLEYDNHHALPVAYDYGILLIDYYNKTVISANDYNCFSLLSSAILNPKLSFISSKQLFNLQYAIEHGATIKGNTIESKPNETYLNFLERLNAKQSNLEEDFTFNISGINDISVSFPNWILKDGSYSYIFEVYQYMKKNGFNLSKQSIFLWNDALQKAKNK